MFLVSKEDIALKELSAKFHQVEMETKSAKGLLWIFYQKHINLFCNYLFFNEF